MQNTQNINIILKTNLDRVKGLIKNNHVPLLR